MIKVCGITIRRILLITAMAGLIISTSFHFMSCPSWAQTDKSSEELEKYLMIYIEFGQLLINHSREKVKLEAEYGSKSSQVRELQRNWARQSQKIFDKWGISSDDYVKNNEAFLQDEQAINAYLADNPDIREQYARVKKKVKKSVEEIIPQQSKDRREFLKANPNVYKRYLEVIVKINKGGAKYGKERTEFLEGHPDIKKEYEEVELEIKKGVEAIRQKRK